MKYADPKPSVLIVGNFLSAQTGIRSVCEELTTQLRQSGWFVITTSNQARRAKRLIDMLYTTWEMHRCYRVAQVDVYSGSAFFWAEAVCLLLRELCCPYVLTLHGGNLPAFSLRHPRRVRNLLRSATVVTTPSRYLWDCMQGYSQDLVLIPNAVAIDTYPFLQRTLPQPKLVWLRAFHHIYNPALAVRTTYLLKEKFPNLKTLMVGPDKSDGSFQEAQNLSSQLAVSDLITVIGTIPKADVPLWLNRGDIFLNTANIDNTPVSVIEAMACGLCIVSTNVGGIPFLLEHEQDALLVPPNDPQAMANSVQRILAEPELAARLSRNARAKAEQYDWPLILPQWENLLMTAAESHT